jgi:hypothetical protein
MADFIRNKSVQGHGIHAASKSALQGILQSNPLLERTSQHMGTFAVLKELCAALLWADAPFFSVEAMKSILAEARATLCAMFGLNRTPINADAQSHRIMNFVLTKRAQSASRSSTQVGCRAA